MIFMGKKIKKAFAVAQKIVLSIITVTSSKEARHVDELFCNIFTLIKYHLNKEKY